MSPAPDIKDETIILNPSSATTVLNGISSSDELDHNQYNEQQMDLGSLTLESMESIDLSNDDDDDNEPPTLTKESIIPLTTCSAPSTPTGERDPHIGFRRSSITSTINNDHELDHVEIKYENGKNTVDTNSDDGNGLIDTFFGCLKPIFSVVNKIGENIKYTKDTSTLTKPTDDWIIPIDNIMNDLVLIGTGIEGCVYRGKLGGQHVACKRVKSEEETNIKHLKKLNHINVIKFRGVSISSPLFYIVMEYCAYGSLYEVLRRRREKNSCTKPTQVLDWSKQISNGVNYLHTNKIVHRDLKSPNILIADNYILKISDFGTSKQLGGNKQDQIMSFNGTSAWMAPEVIRKEPCSEKIDVWSFGIVLWEILTCEVPYHNIDPSAVMWGVGKGSLTLPIPSSVPDGFKLLMTLCWNQKPINRPSFQQIIKHLNVSEPQIILFEQEQEYAELTRVWSIEINEQLARLPTIDISSTLQMSNDELLKKRKEELQHISDIRVHYQTKLHQVNTLYIELSSLMMQLQKREQEIKKKERLYNIQHHSSTGNSNGKKRTINSLTEARKKSLQLIKAASFSLHDPIMMLSQTSTKKSQPNTGLTNNRPSVNLETIIPSNSSTGINNQDSSSNKTIQRRKKGPGHRRTNSKGSTTSWTPPSLSAIADQEKKRASIHLTSNIIDENFNLSNIHSPIPSISADIDSKSITNNRQLNPKNLKLDLQNSNDSQITPTIHQRPSTIFTYAARKSSSSDQEDNNDNQHQNLSRQRRKRNNLNLIQNKISSPSSVTIRSIKSNSDTPQIDEIDNHSNRLIEDKNDNNDLRRYHKNVSFHFSSPTISERSPSYQQRKNFNRQTRYSSSEEGEVEEIHSDHFVLDDEKHRAKHENLNRDPNGIFSSESEIYNENNTHSLSLKNEGTFSDEGGHVSDDRPASRESLLNSEPEHEWLDQE